MNNKAFKIIKILCCVGAVLFVVPILALVIKWGVIYPEISLNDYNGRCYHEIGSSSIYNFTTDKKIGHTENWYEIYTIKGDENRDFLYCSSFGDHFIVTALDYEYEDMDRISKTGTVTGYKVVRERDYEYFYGSDQNLIDAMAKLDANPDLLEPAGDYTKEVIGGPMYRIDLCFNHMPVSLDVQKGLVVDIEHNQAYYMPERYVSGNDRTIYKVLDEDINQLLVDTIKNAEFEKG